MSERGDGKLAPASGWPGESHPLGDGCDPGLGPCAGGGIRQSDAVRVTVGRGWGTRRRDRGQTVTRAIQTGHARHEGPVGSCGERGRCCTSRFRVISSVLPSPAESVLQASLSLMFLQQQSSCCHHQPYSFALLLYAPPCTGRASVPSARTARTTLRRAAADRQPIRPEGREAALNGPPSDLRIVAFAGHRPLTEKG